MTPTNRFMDQERAEYLKAKIQSSPRTAALPAWPRADKDLPLVELEVSWIRFSTLNHRTRAEQLRYSRVKNTPELFTRDPLGGAAQAAQYEILRAQKGFLELKEDLAERKQQENATVTADGVVINGNRRAAALRSLFEDDSRLDARYVRCLVLPADATPEELLALETELQVAKDFKQDYSWVNQALLIEELYEANNRDFDRVARMMHRKASELKDDYEKIQQVNQLVQLSGGARLHVEFEENESAFDELAKHIRSKPAAEKQAVRSVYFLGTLAGVNYRELRHLRRQDADALVRAELEGNRQLDDVLKLATSVAPAADATDDLLAGVLGTPQAPNPVDQLLGLVAAKKPNEALELPSHDAVEMATVLRLVKLAIEKAASEAEEQQKDANAVGAPAERLKKALLDVQRALDALPAARAVPGWNETAFQTALNDLRSKLKDFDKA